MRLTITQATLHKTKKDGSPLIDRKNRPYMRAVIKTNEYGDQFLSGFVYKELVVGEEIEATVETEEYMGKPQLKFALDTSGKTAAAGAQNDSVVGAELKNHTVLLKAILNELERLNLSQSTHQTIEQLKKKEPTFDVPDSEFPE